MLCHADSACIFGVTVYCTEPAMRAVENAEMRISELLGKRSAAAPKDAMMPSHQLLLRGGYIRQVGQGIFSLLPLAQRVRGRIEAILRQEMNALGGQELQMPIVIPADLWKESGRYEAIGAELVRFDDRTGHPHVLAMTNEETVVDLVRANVDSYRQLPLVVYQLQSKFRDEPRSRGGLIRVREFTMKDAYSFHRTQEDLEQFYQRCRLTYHRVFRRCGLTQVVDIESSVGMMGGRVAHEFMLLSPHGEDNLLLCTACDYRANREVASVRRVYGRAEQPEALCEVETPSRKTIEEVAAFFQVTRERCCKAVLFRASDGRALAAFVRGDFDVDEAKLRAAVSATGLRPLRESEMEELGLTPGFVGPIGLDTTKVVLCIDRSITETPNLIIGANKAHWHCRGFNASRDVPGELAADITQAVAGDPCPKCGKELRTERGVELGNIFQLGTKYTSQMGFTYTEEDGTSGTPLMGCYGIGVGRALACIVEEHHDEHGPLWPPAVAPFDVHVCALKAQKGEIGKQAEQIHANLMSAGVETLLDTRDVGPGFMFADADLIGAPVRAIVSPRNFERGVIELKYRLPFAPSGLPETLPLEDASAQIAALVERLRA